MISPLSLSLSLRRRRHLVRTFQRVQNRRLLRLAEALLLLLLPERALAADQIHVQDSAGKLVLRPRAGDAGDLADRAQLRRAVL